MSAEYLLGMLWLSGRKSCDRSSQDFVMVPSKSERERHTEGEKGELLNNDASKSFLSRSFFSGSCLFRRKWRTAHRRTEPVA